MAAGDVTERGDHDGDREAMRGGDAEEAEAAGAVEELIGADGAGAEEDQREGAEKFGRELLRNVVHTESSPPGRGTSPG